MTAFQIVTIVSTMLEAGQTAEQCAQALELMGFFGGEQTAEAAEAAEAVLTTIGRRADHGRGSSSPVPAEFQRGNGGTAGAFGAGGGIAPSVKYKLATGLTAARLAQMVTGRPLQIASFVAKHRNGVTKREIATALNITKGAAMSAIHNGQQRGVLDTYDVTTGKLLRRGPKIVATVAATVAATGRAVATVRKSLRRR